MPSGRGADFEPTFGSREPGRPIEPLPSSPGSLDDVSVGELVDSVEAKRTIGAQRSSASADPPTVRERGPALPSPVMSDRAADPRRPDETLRSVGAPISDVGGRWSRVLRRFVVAVLAVVLVGVGYFAVSLLQVWNAGRADDRGPVDAIVVMGAAQWDGRPSPQLAARLDHALEVWNADVAPLIVVTGGNIPGDRFTEAEASAIYLEDRGVPTASILMENAGSSSYESLASVAELLAERGVDEVVIVSDPYHALRSKLIAEEVGLDASVSSTDTSVVTGFESLSRHVREAGGVAIGRIIGFERLTEIVG